jgi:hypothetical protein
MRRQFLRIVIALIGVAGLGLSAKAQSLDQIEFNTPHEFVAGGKTFPAGTYRVRRVSITDPKLLFLSSVETRETAMIHATWEESSGTDKNDVSFVQVGDEHFLNKIETPNHLFSIEVSRSEILDAVAKSQSGTSATGSTGNK